MPRPWRPRSRMWSRPCRGPGRSCSRASRTRPTRIPPRRWRPARLPSRPRRSSTRTRPPRPSRSTSGPSSRRPHDPRPVGPAAPHREATRAPTPARSAGRARGVRRRRRARHLRAGAGGRHGARRAGLVGLSQTLATQSAKADGLSLHVIHRVALDPAGVVLSQSPPAGEWLYGGHTITVTVSATGANSDIFQSYYSCTCRQKQKINQRK